MTKPHTPGVAALKPDALEAIFGQPKAVIGTIHLRPLPGAPAYRGEPVASVIEVAIQDARAYVEGGIHGLIVENSGDLPFAKPEDIGFETVSHLTAVTAAIVAETRTPVGVNCLANGVVQAIAVAAAAGARFVRSNQWVNAYIANEGFVEGAAARALRFRSHIRAHGILIFADVHVKHGSHAIVADRSVSEQARDAEFFDADVLIATGQRTGDATSADEVKAIRDGSRLPVIVGSGLTAANVDDLFRHADGAIVGSSLKQDSAWWKPVEVARVRSLMERVQAIHSSPTR